MYIHKTLYALAVTATTIKGIRRKPGHRLHPGPGRENIFIVLYANVRRMCHLLLKSYLKNLRRGSRNYSPRVLTYRIL